MVILLTAVLVFAGVLFIKAGIKVAFYLVEAVLLLVVCLVIWHYLNKFKSK